MSRRPSAAERELKLQIDLMTEQRREYDDQARRATLRADTLNEQIGAVAKRLNELRLAREKPK